ncbi:myb-related transcription factor, partner of profilin-like isoform X1 [Sinocyclocheilus rhinocerous]|uniref:myb-related transcription factor, partner of profilin-like isoform X1 n=1 Tax=Sinocyclocheilus rhinocerous TaxID=307959 RepID=UPI0007BA6EBB|nr:PREDICTED: myb-related transcription factor, partner of profilin-like isoform X1 [Sinocyclocheilus rhinocerous]
MASQAKKRKTNFSEREVEIIVEEMEKQKHILVNHFNAGVTHIAKNSAWVEILKRVNAVSTCQRELAEVKKKWSDLKTEVRRKVAQARAAMEGTGDCSSVPVILSSMQQRICNLLGEATIISLPAAEITVPISSATAAALTQSKTLALLLRNFTRDDVPLAGGRHGGVLHHRDAGDRDLRGSAGDAGGAGRVQTAGTEEPHNAQLRQTAAGAPRHQPARARDRPAPGEPERPAADDPPLAGGPGLRSGETSPGSGGNAGRPARPHPDVQTRSEGLEEVSAERQQPTHCAAGCRRDWRRSGKRAAADRRRTIETSVCVTSGLE